MFTELGAALEEAGVKLPAAEEVMSLATVADLVRQVAVWRRGGGGRRTEAVVRETVVDARKARREKQRSLLGHLLHRASFGADALLRDLASALADPRAQVRALHVFTMNRVEQTLVWQRRMLKELGDN